MTKQQMLNTIQREYQRAKKITDSLWQDYLDETDGKKIKNLLEERKAWLYVCFELRDLLEKFGVEVAL